MYRKRNQKIEHAGKVLSLNGWAAELGISRVVLWQRIYKYKLPLEKAFSTEKYLQEQKGRIITWGDKISQATLGKSKPPLSEEHKKKIGEAQKGSKSHWWITDRTKLKTGRVQMYDYQYKLWMKQVKNRDKWKCRIGNEDCSGRLEAHHILPWSQSPELRYEVNNGISLCHYHHPRKREEEQRLAPTFQEMVLRPAYALALSK